MGEKGVVIGLDQVTKDGDHLKVAMTDLSSALCRPVWAYTKLPLPSTTAIAAVGNHNVDFIMASSVLS